MYNLITACFILDSVLMAKSLLLPEVTPHLFIMPLVKQKK